MIPEKEKLETVRRYFIEVAVICLILAVVYLYKELRAQTNEVLVKQTEAITAASEIIKQNTAAFNELTKVLNAHTTQINFLITQKNKNK
jgi:hypothetical protein